MPMSMSVVFPSIDPPKPAAVLSMDLLLEEALRAMARAAEQFRSLGEKQAKRLMVAGSGGGKLREVATQLEQVRDLLGGVDDGGSSPAAAESFYGIDDLLDEIEYHRIAFHLEASPNPNPKVSNPLASALRLGRRFLSSSSDGQASRSRWFLKDLDSAEIGRAHV